MMVADMGVRLEQMCNVLYAMIYIVLDMFCHLCKDSTRSLKPSCSGLLRALSSGLTSEMDAWLNKKPGNSVKPATSAGKGKNDGGVSSNSMPVMPKIKVKSTAAPLGASELSKKRLSS